MDEPPPGQTNGGTRVRVPPPVNKCCKSLEGHPDAIAPIAMAFVIFAPAHPLMITPVAMEVPIVRMIFEGDAGPVITGIDMPAIAFAIAGDIRYRRHRECRQRAGAHQAAEDQTFEFHELSPCQIPFWCTPTKENGGAKVPFPEPFRGLTAID